MVPTVILSPKHSHYNDIIKFMSKEYFPNEPTCKALGVTNCSVLLDRVLLVLTQGISLIAKCKKTGNILGVALNEKTTPWDAEMVDKLARTVQCPQVSKLLHFYAFVERVPNIFDKYNVSEVFEIANVGVAADFQNLGIGYELMKKSKEIAEKNGFEIVRVDATSFYTARICERMKMDVIYEIPYRTYLDADRKPVFDIPLPHTGVKVFISQLPKKTRSSGITKK